MANTRPIRHLRAPRFFKKRRPARPYSTGNYIGSNVPVNATTTELLLTQYTDWDQVSNVAINGLVKIHRTMFRGAIMWTQAETTYVQQSTAWLWAVAVIDDDDVETNLWDVTDNAFVNHKILKWGFAGRMMREVPTATVANPGGQGGIPISYDIRFRKPVALRAGDQLVLIIQGAANYTNTLTNAGLWGCFRNVVEPVGVGF